MTSRTLDSGNPYDEVANCCQIFLGHSAGNDESVFARILCARVGPRARMRPSGLGNVRSDQKERIWIAGVALSDK